MLLLLLTPKRDIIFNLMKVVSIWKKKNTGHSAKHLKAQETKHQYIYIYTLDGPQRGRQRKS